MSKLSAFIAEMTNRGHSGLDQILIGQIKKDEFQLTLKRLAALPEIKTILEIGSSDGRGSTVGIAKGMRKNPSTPQLHAIEFSQRRFKRLAKRYKKRPDIHCHNVVTVNRSEFMSEADIAAFTSRYARDFYKTEPEQAQKEFMELLAESNSYIDKHAIPEDGIESIKSRFGIPLFDLVLIDGGPFTGEAELNHVIGAKFIAFDDIYDIKNHAAHTRMLADPNYELVAYSKLLRTGYSVFRRRLE